MLAPSSSEIIYKVARQLNTSLDLDEVLGKVLRLTVDATGAGRGSLFLLDETGQVTRRILARSNQTPEVSRRNVNMAMTQGLAGWVYRHRQGALAADATQDERWVHLPGDTEITGSAVVVPLIYQERINGLLALHHEQVRFFDESHMALTANIAVQAAVAVENARLFTQVKNEREELYALINAMPNPVLVVDAEDCITFANETALQSLLIEKTGLKLDQLAAGEQLKAALNELRHSTEKQTELSWSDDRVFNLSINEVTSLGTVMVLDDITHFKELDAMKSHFVETVSHDLKNPLSVIKGFAQLLELEKNLSQTGKNNLVGILRGAAQMQALIENLLDLAQIESGLNGRVEPCDFVQITLDVLDNMALRFEEKQLTLVTDLPPDLPLLAANRLRLSQVVSNFVSNAVKYTPAQGQVAVKLSQEDMLIRLSVTDTGPGIPPAAQAQLFQKFYRVPQTHAQKGVSGTGLGLSIVKAVVESYGGQVWVESKVDQGSTFGCSLPLSPETHGEAQSS